MRPPKSIFIFGALNVVFACTGLISLIQQAMTLPRLDFNNPQSGGADLLVFTWTFISISLLARVALLAGGVGLLADRAWGRTLSLAYCGYAPIAFLASAGAYVLFLLLPALMMPEKFSDAETSNMIATALTRIAAAAIVLIYPAALWLAMRRPEVKWYFAGLTWPKPPRQPANSGDENLGSDESASSYRNP